MDKKIFSSSTIGIILTIVVTIFPLTQIILLTLNGGLTYLFTLPFNSNKSETATISSITFNSFAFILGIIFYYRAKKTWQKIISVFLIMFSGQMLVLFLADQSYNGDNYLAGYTAVSGIPTLIVVTIGILKYYFQNNQTPMKTAV